MKLSLPRVLAAIPNNASDIKKITEGSGTSDIFNLTSNVFKKFSFVVRPIQPELAPAAVQMGSDSVLKPDTEICALYKCSNSGNT